MTLTTAVDFRRVYKCWFHWALVCLFSILWEANSYAGGLAGRVVSVNGGAYLQDNLLKVGDEIHEGDLIRTEKNAGVKILMNDRSVIDVSNDSKFLVKAYQVTGAGERNVNLDLDFGAVRASVSKKLSQKSKFTIRTKSSVLAVRGTEFSASWRAIDGKVKEQITVAHGTVDVKPTFGEAKPISLGEGKQFVSTGVFKGDRIVASGTNKESGFHIASLSQKEASRVVASSGVEDKTFNKNIDLAGADVKSGGVSNAGAATVSSIAIATGAKEYPKARGPRSEGSNSEGRANREEKSSKSENDKREGGLSSKDVPGGAGIPGGSHSPGGDVPGRVDSTPSNSTSNATVRIKVTFP